MIKTKLYNTFYTNWFSDSVKVYFSGILVYKHYTVLDANSLYKLLEILFQENEDIDFFEIIENDLLRIASGTFSLILYIRNEVFVASDIVRSFPLFIINNENDSFLVTDNLSKIDNVLIADPIYVNLFIACNHIPGSNNIFKNVRSVQAGELLHFHDKSVESHRYFSFIPKSTFEKIDSINEFAKIYDQVLLNAFNNNVNNISSGSRWIVPLSGGHDSRLTVNYLFRLGIKNVICYSYGIPGNEQSQISKEVAEALNYEWHFVEYSEQKWKSLHDSKLFDEYLSFAFNGISTPHFQDFLAVHELTEKRILKKGDIFLKSHGDFIVGNHLKEKDLNLTNNADAIDRVISLHTRITSSQSKQAEQVKKVFDGLDILPQHYQEFYNWQERQAKYIINSLRVYDYFGYESRVPFWDKGHVDFWLGIHSDYRVRRNLFLESEKRGLLIASLQSIPYASVVKESPKLSARSIILQLVPSHIINILLRITGRKPKLNEALNQVYALKSETVKELLNPTKDFPQSSYIFFKDLLGRYSYQVNESVLTTLYTIRREILDK